MEIFEPFLGDFTLFVCSFSSNASGHHFFYSSGCRVVAISLLKFIGDLQRKPYYVAGPQRFLHLLDFFFTYSYFSFNSSTKSYTKLSPSILRFFFEDCFWKPIQKFLAVWIDWIKCFSKRTHFYTSEDVSHYYVFHETNQYGKHKNLVSIKL